VAQKSTSTMSLLVTVSSKFSAVRVMVAMTDQRDSRRDHSLGSGRMTG
jgi:hypothetical protein